MSIVRGDGRAKKQSDLSLQEVSHIDGDTPVFTVTLDNGGPDTTTGVQVKAPPPAN